MQDYLGMQSFAGSFVNEILHRRFGGIEPDDKRINVQLGIRESLFVRARLEIAHNNHNHRNQQVNCNFSFQQIIARTDSSQHCGGVNAVCKGTGSTTSHHGPQGT